jgi:nuclear pore complex protein Nup93
MQMQSKMMVYDQVISDLNNARLQGTSFPILHTLIQASHRVNTDVSQATETFIS